MAKSHEQKIVDAFENARSIHAGEFARLISQGSPQVQYTFYDAMLAYISYKAVFADHYRGEHGDLDRDSLVVVCQYLRDCLQDYFPNLEIKNAQTHYLPPELT